MFVTEGPLAPDNPLFVGREDELRRMEGWLQHPETVGGVLGARQTGKTSLMLRFADKFKGVYPSAYITLESIFDASEPDCFSFVCGELTRKFASRVPAGMTPCPARDAAAFHAFMLAFAREVRATHVVVMLDEVGALAPQSFESLGHAIRAIITNRLQDQELQKFHFILSGSTEMIRLTTDRLSPLSNCMENVYINDLSHGETDDLLSRGFGPEVKVSRETSERIYYWASGHPYLTQRIAKGVMEKWSANAQDPGPAGVDAMIGDLLRYEDKNLPHLRRTLDRVRPSLWPVVVDVLEGKRVSFSRGTYSAAQLELIGAVREHDGMCVVRNRIYEQALRAWMSPTRQPPGCRQRAAHAIRSMREISGPQRLALGIAIMGLILDQVTNWVPMPAVFSDAPWLIWAIVGGAGIMFIVLTMAHGPSVDGPPGGGAGSDVEEAAGTRDTRR